MLSRRGAASVNWIDACVGYLAAWRGLYVLASLVSNWTRWLDFPYGWAYASHAWDLAIPLAWYFALRRLFPIGTLRWSELRGWIVPGLATLCVSVASLFTFYAFVGTQIHDAFNYSAAGWAFETIAPGLGEEFLFRGLVQSGLNASIPLGFTLRGVRLSLGTIVTSLLFGLAHLGQQQPVFLTVAQLTFGPLVGLVIGIGYERTKNIWGAVIVHNLADLLNYALSLALP